MPSLRTEPAGRVDTLDELFALAYAIEASAASRYDEAAKLLDARGASHLADIFARLAALERGHMDEVRAWAASHGQRDPSAARLPWPIPDAFDASADEFARSKLLTPYLALAAAVRQGQRIFSFWSYVAAHATRADVQRLAERIAHEELERVSLLRRERREAFHAQRDHPDWFVVAADAAALAGMERHLAGLVEADQRLENSAAARDIARGAAKAAAKLEALAVTHDATVSLPKLPAGANDDLLAVAEVLVEAYLALGDTSKEAAVVRAAQDLAGQAIRRLAALRAELGAGADTPSGPLPARPRRA